MTTRPVGVLLLALFFLAATGVLISVGISLLLPGTPLDAIWLLRPDRQALLMPYRQYVGPGFLALAIPMALASVGCFLGKPWGWWLAVAIFAANGIGDAVQLLTGHLLEGAFGLVVAGALIFWLTRPQVRAAFGRR